MSVSTVRCSLVYKGNFLLQMKDITCRQCNESCINKYVATKYVTIHSNIYVHNSNVYVENSGWIYNTYT